MRGAGRVGAVAMALMLAGNAAPALAGMDQTWVATEGVDSGLCMIYEPCRTLAFALDQTSTGGTINVIDTGAYGVVTVGKSITIRSELGSPAIIASIIVNAAPTDKVVIEGLELEGAGQSLGVAYPYGIAVLQAGDVLINAMRIKDYNVASTVGAGVYINSTSQVRVTINDCVLFNNRVGVVVTSASGNAHLKAFRSLWVGNTDSGVRVIGSGNDAMMSANSMLGSTKAMDLQSGGAARSFGNNAITSGDVPIAMPLY